MSTASLNFPEILKDVPAGAWVAVSEREQRVLGYGSDVQSVTSAAQSQGEGVPLVLKVPERQEILFF